MKPILFSPTATDFTKNGIGRLSDAISCTVHEARNGEFELELVYPMDGVHYTEIIHSAIIVAKPSARRSPQPFRIYKITKPLSGKVTVLARHISYQLSFIPVSPFSAGSLANALSGFKSNAAEACPFTLSADFSSSSSYAVPIPTGIRSYLGGQRGSILDVYGGEWEWNGYNCILHRNRGQDNGYTIRYGKNLVDLKQEQNIEATYTGVYPFWQSEETMVTLPEKVIHAATAANFPFQRTLVMDFSDQWDNAPTVAQLRAYTQAFVAQAGIGIPNVNLSTNFINLADTEEYRELLTTANIDLCDIVTVQFEKLGVSVQSKVIDIEYDVLKERYASIQIGDKRSTLATTIEDQIKQIATLATTEEVGRTVDRATGVLNSGRRGHVIINRNAEGWANEILFLDNENLSAARNVLRINMAGIGFSSTGYQGPYYQSWTMDGHFSLGGVNNAYGDFQILDGSGKVLGEWDKDGLKFYDNSATQKMLMLVNHGGLFLYDTNGGTLAQLTNQGLNVYKGTIQGATIIAGGSADGSFIVRNASGNTIGTWDKNGISIHKGIIDIARGNEVGIYCDGERFQFGDFEVNTDYGRQVLESTDEMTGMGGEPDDEGGLYLWAGYRDEGDYAFVVNDAGAYTMYDGTAYNIGQTLHYILENCCSGGGDCPSDGGCTTDGGCSGYDCMCYGEADEIADGCCTCHATSDKCGCDGSECVDACPGEDACPSYGGCSCESAQCGPGDGL